METNRRFLYIPLVGISVFLLMACGQSGKVAEPTNCSSWHSDGQYWVNDCESVEAFYADEEDPDTVAVVDSMMFTIEVVDDLKAYWKELPGEDWEDRVALRASYFPGATLYILR